MMGIGKRFQSIDDAYRQYIHDLVVPEATKTTKMEDMGKIDQARTVVGTAAADKGALGASIRYGVPATGLTAAGMGLVAVMNQFGGPEDQPEEGTLMVSHVTGPTPTQILQAAQALRGA